MRPGDFIFLHVFILNFVDTQTLLVEWQDDTRHSYAQFLFIPTLPRLDEELMHRAKETGAYISAGRLKVANMENSMPFTSCLCTNCSTRIGIQSASYISRVHPSSVRSSNIRRILTLIEWPRQDKSDAGLEQRSQASRRRCMRRVAADTIRASWKRRIFSESCLNLPFSIPKHHPPSVWILKSLALSILIPVRIPAFDCLEPRLLYPGHG